MSSRWHGIGSEGPVDTVGQASCETPEFLIAGFAFGVSGDLGEGGVADDSAELAVPSTVERVPVDPAGTCWDG